MRFFAPGDTNALETAVHNRLAAELEEGNGLSVEDRLKECVPAGAVAEVMAIIDSEAEKAGMHYACEVLRRIAVLFAGKSIMGAGLAHLLGAGNEQSLDELARQFGCSKQAVHQAKQRVRAVLFPLLPDACAPRLPKPVVRPTEQGEWLCVGEAIRLTGLSADALHEAARRGDVRSVRLGKRRFIDEASLLEYVSKSQIATAEAELQRRVATPEAEA